MHQHEFEETVFISGVKTLLKISISFKTTIYYDKAVANVYLMGKFERYNDGEIKYYPASNPTRSISTFNVVADHNNKTVTLGPTGALGMLPKDIQGKGVGTYCISRLINLLLPKCEYYSLTPGKLSVVDASNESSKQNRNNFYRRLGVTLSLDENEQYGKFSCEYVGKINIKWNRAKVRRMSPLSINLLLTKSIDSQKRLIKLNTHHNIVNLKNNELEKAVNNKSNIIWLLSTVVLILIFI